MLRGYSSSQQNFAQVVVNRDNDVSTDIELSEQCNSCNSQSTIPHAIQITRYFLCHSHSSHTHRFFWV